jgi:hypothetical protein
MSFSRIQVLLFCHGPHGVDFSGILLELGSFIVEPLLLFKESLLLGLQGL